MSGDGAGQEAGAVVRALVAALAAGREADVLALTDPQVVWQPAYRPGLSRYVGHAGMAMLVADLGAAPGPYRLVVGDPGGGRLDVAPDGGTRVRVEVTAVARGADGREVALRPVLAEFTVRGGLVTAMEARHED